METLGPHELAHVFAQLTDPADIARARAVCHLWRDTLSPPLIYDLQLADVLRLAPNVLLEVACRIDSFELAKYAINHGATYFDGGLYKACRGGQKEIAELMIRHGATDFNSGLCCACERGHKEIVELLIDRGATDFVAGLYHACRSDHKEIAELLGKRAPTTSCSHCHRLGAEHV